MNLNDLLTGPESTLVRSLSRGMSRRDGRPRSWWRDVSADAADAEIIFLRTNIYQNPAVEPLCRVINAFDRHSHRV